MSAAPQPAPPPTWLGCVGRDLLGGRGLVPALVAWVVVALLAGMAFAVGLAGLVPLGAAMIVLGAVAFRSPGRPAAAVVAMAVSLVVGLAAFGYAWWVLGISIDAADAGDLEPAAAGWGGAALVTLALSAAAFLVAAIVAVRRSGTAGTEGQGPSGPRGGGG